MLEVDIVPCQDIPDHRHAEKMAWCVGKFLESVPTGRRKCIGCQHVWTTEQPWPGGFMFVRAWGDDKHWALFGICPECWNRDLIGICKEVMNEIAPGEMLDGSHSAPDGRQ